LILAIYFRKHGPQGKKFGWEIEEEEEKNEIDTIPDNNYDIITKENIELTNDERDQIIKYIYRKKEGE